VISKHIEMSLIVFFPYSGLELKEKGLVSVKELPYENILTRLTAEIFFMNPNEDLNLKKSGKNLNHIKCGNTN
jgi:hypothetical protein